MISINVSDATLEKGAGVTIKVRGSGGTHVSSGTLSKPLPSRTTEDLDKLVKKILLVTEDEHAIAHEIKEFLGSDMPIIAAVSKKDNKKKK